MDNLNMITDTTIQSGEEILTTEDESPQGVRHLKSQISQLSIKNEQYKQELHELHRKLEISQTMEAELTEFQRTLEQSLDQQKAQTNRKIHEIEEKHMAKEKELQDKIAEMESDLAQLTEDNKALREDIKISHKRFESLHQSQPDANSGENINLLKSQIEELADLVSHEEEVRRQHEETIRAMEREIEELKEILAAAKKQLIEKNEATESMRQELMECRIELESLKTAPATEKSKGNSLFAEVEDRRKMTLDQMNSMRSSYLEAKRLFQAKEAEIKALKVERSLLLRKWEDDTVEKIQQDASLVEKYRARIAELEARLKEEQKKNKQIMKSQQLPENNFTFLQSLVDSKSKEIEELTAKLENDSLKELLDEENKHKMGKQLRHWRYRAMSVEAELLMIKDHLESDPSNSNTKILESIKKRLSERNVEPNESFRNEDPSRDFAFVNETTVTLDSLMAIPMCRPKDRPFSEKSNVVDKVNDHPETSKNNSTLPVDDAAVIRSRIPTHKSNKKELAKPDVQSILPIEETAVISSHVSTYKPIKKEPVETNDRRVLPMEETAVISSHISTYKPIQKQSVEPNGRSVLPMEETAVISSHISTYKPIEQQSVEPNGRSVLPMEETAVISSHISTYENEKEKSVEPDIRSVSPMEETAVIRSHISTYKPYKDESMDPNIQRVLPMEETAVIRSHISTYEPNKKESVESDIRTVLPMEETAVIRSHMSAYKPIKEDSTNLDSGSDLSMEETAIIHSHISTYKPSEEELVQPDVGKELPMEETAVIRSNISTYRTSKEDSVTPDFGYIPMEETAVIRSHISTYNSREEESTEPNFGNIIPMEETTVIRSHISTYNSRTEESMMSDFQRLDDSMKIEGEKSERAPNSVLIDNKKSLIPNYSVTRPALKSVLSRNHGMGDSNIVNSEKNEKEKKTLRFAPDTIDPPNKTLKKQSTTAPKYPIVFISSNKSKK